MSKNIYVIDTSTLFYFYFYLKSPNILYSLFKDVLKIVPAVKRELLKLAKKKIFYGKIISDLQSKSLQIEDVDLYDQRVQDFIYRFKNTLHTGERFSAALAFVKGYILIIDDRAARREIMYGYTGITCKDAKWVLKRARNKRLIGKKKHIILKKKLCKL